MICVHLTSNDETHLIRFFTTGMRRLRELDHLLGYLGDLEGEVLLAGDFNAGPGMFEHAALALRTRWIPHCRPTFPSHCPLLQLDHFFLKGDLRAGSIRTEKTIASDHHPLVADIHFSAAG